MVGLEDSVSRRDRVVKMAYDTNSELTRKLLQSGSAGCLGGEVL